MSTHPNAILLAVLTPDDLTRKTYRAILEEAGIESEDQLKIGEMTYSIDVMEDGYDENNQISAPEGSIIMHGFLTYGYGENASWENVAAAKAALEEFLAGICERHHCKSEVFITANYW